MLVQMDHAAILITDKKISSVQEILPILQSLAAAGRGLLIIAEGIEGDALSTLVVNKLRGTLKVAAVKAPGFGDRRKAMLEDIAVLTGGIFVSEEKGMLLKRSRGRSPWPAEKIEISKETTTIVGGAGRKEEIDTRIKVIDGELSASSNDYDREKLEERKAKTCRRCRSHSCWSA